jgi:hypothetical protein
MSYIHINDHKYYEPIHMNKSVALLVVIIILIVVSNACSQNNKRNEEKSILNLASEQDSIAMDLKLAELLQQVLDLPFVVRYSKIDLIRGEHEEVYISFDENVLKTNSLSINQNGYGLKVINHNEIYDKPCYLFKTIEIRDSTAYVSLDFDITGFTCAGNLNFVNGKWVPDKDFRVGYR